MIQTNTKKKKRIVIAAKNTKESDNKEKEIGIDDNLNDGILTDKELRSIFNAKCQDFRIKGDDKLYQRFKYFQSKKLLIKTFDMESCSIGPLAAEAICKILPNHSNYKVLNLGGNSLYNEGAVSIAKFLAHNKSIISVDISSCMITDIGAAAIFRALFVNRSVIVLNIGSTTCVSRNSIGNVALEELKYMLIENNILSELNLSMSEICCDTMLPLSIGLSQNHFLQSLNLANNHIRSKGANQIINALMDSNISELNLSFNHIDDNIAPQMKAFLSKNLNITKIDLSGNNLTSRFMIAIASPLSKTMLTDLNVSRNPIGGKGLSAIGPSLAINKYLKILNVSGCQIDSKGFNDFCLDIIKNIGITYLNVSQNPLLDEGVSTLVEVIKVHPSLRELDLELTELTDVGAIPLFEVIPLCKTLEKLSFKNNLVHDGLKVQKYLSSAPHIQTCNLEYNDIDYKLVLAINRTLEINNHLHKENEHKKFLEKVRYHHDTSAQLLDMRADIFEEKEYIDILRKNLANAQLECETAEESKNKKIHDLEVQLDQILNDSSNYQTELRNQYEILRTQTSSVNNEVVSMQNRLKQKTEMFQMRCKDLNVVENKIIDQQQKNNSEMIDINERLDDAKRKYLDIKMMFLAAYNEAKNTNHVSSLARKSQKQGPAPALEEGEGENESDEKDVEEKVIKKKKKKKVEKNTKKKNEATGTDDKPTKSEDEKNKSSNKKKKKSEKSSKSGQSQNTKKSSV